MPTTQPVLANAVGNELMTYVWAWSNLDGDGTDSQYTCCGYGPTGTGFALEQTGKGGRNNMAW